MTTASNQRNKGRDVPQRHRAAATPHTAASHRHQEVDFDRPPVLFRLPDVSSAIASSSTARPEREAPVADQTTPSSNDGRSLSGQEGSGQQDLQTPAQGDRPPADFPRPPESPSFAGEDFPPPPEHPQPPVFGKSMAPASGLSPQGGNGLYVTPTADSSSGDRTPKSVRQSASAAPAGRNWMETIGSRVVLLLLLGAVAAAAILAGRGTDPADEIRLAGKPGGLLSELGITDGEPVEAAPENANTGSETTGEVVEPPLSYDEFIAQTESGDSGHATSGEEHGHDHHGPSDTAAADTHAELTSSGAEAPCCEAHESDLAQNHSESNVGDATASPNDLSTPSQAADASPNGSMEDGPAFPLQDPIFATELDGASADESKETEIAAESDQGSMPSVDGPESGAMDESAPRVANAPNADPLSAEERRRRRMISEPRSISEPQANNFFDSPAGSDANNELPSDFPVNPYDENPYAAERAGEISGATMSDPRLAEPNFSDADAPQREASAGAKEPHRAESTMQYGGTSNQQSVDWERYIPSDQPQEPSAYPATPDSEPATGFGVPQGDGLQPPANAPQQGQRDFAGSYGPAGAYGAAAAQAAQQHAHQPAFGAASPFAPPGAMRYSDPRYPAANGMPQMPQQYGAMPPQMSQPNGAAHPQMPQQFSQQAPPNNGYPANGAYPPASYGAPQNGMPHPNAGSYGAGPIQQAISPYDAPRR